MNDNQSNFSSDHLSQNDYLLFLEYALLDSPHNLLCEIDEAGCFINLSSSCFQVFGYEPCEIIGKSFHELVEEKDRDYLSAVISQLKTESKPTSFENRCLHKNGTKIDIVWTLHWSESKSRFFVAGCDMTSRRELEKALRLEANLMNALMQNIPDAIYFKDRESRFSRVSQHVHLRGISAPEEALGKTDFDFFAAEHASVAFEDEQRIMRTGKPVINKEEREVFPDGSICWVSSSKAPVYDAEGKITGIVGVSRDITELKRAHAVSLENEYKLSTLIESMREGLLQVNNQDSIIFVNDCFCEMVGYTTAELMNTDWKHLLYDGKEHALVREVNRRRGKGISDSYELCLKKKSGERLWFIVGGAPVLSAEGTITGSLGVFTDITTRKLAEERLRYEVLHDGLTGLANRTHFNDHLQRAIDRNKRHQNEMFAVLFLDFDRFKIINDSLGHTEGDNLLKQIARRLKAVLRSGDMVARLGGDEFTILVNSIDDSSVALRIAERIQKKLQTPFKLADGDVYISASIGIALSTTGYQRAEDMLRDADIAMYRAKSKGKAQHQVFDREMHEQATRVLSLETEIRQALTRDEFILYYQPIFNLQTNELIGFESLVRWLHPQHGLVSPHEFIPIVEENNLIIPLGRWILFESCRQLRAWQESNPQAANLSISVNLSSKQFLQTDLADQIARTLEATGLAGKCLKLEITESQLMTDTETAIKTLVKLQTLGIELSLDDFGTGYSSLSYLHRLPFTYLKIDRSFVGKMQESGENFEIINTIIRLGQNLKMKIIAEGIESEMQYEYLKSLNCEFGQGFYLAKPMSAQAAKDFLTKTFSNSLKKLSRTH